MDIINFLLDEIYEGSFLVAARERLPHIRAARDTVKLPRKAHWDEKTWC